MIAENSSSPFLRLCAFAAAAARSFQRVATDKRGNVLIITAFALLPLSFATGMGIDYTRAMRVQTRLNAITDAAALSTVTQPLMSQTIPAACNIARNVFTAQQAGTNGLILNTLDLSQFNIVITDTYSDSSSVTVTCPIVGVPVVGTSLPTSRQTVVTYNGQNSNSFAAILGLSSLTVKGTGTAKASLSPYIDIHLALDTSQSMGLASSNTDALNLWAATKATNGPNSGCQFGCHVYQSSDSGYNKSQVPNDQIAKSAGIRLRVDELRDATTSMISSAMSGEGNNSYYRFGLYRIGATSSVISALSPNLSQAQSTVQNLTLGPNNSGGIGDTNLPDGTTQMQNIITVHGDGTSQAKARAFLFLVTDGVTDTQGGGCTYGHCTKPIDPATCQYYKDNGITVGIIYTTYLPVYADPTNPSNKTLRAEYQNLIKTFTWPGYVSPHPSDNSQDIQPALQACASTGWFYQADDGPGIQIAMQKLFNQVAHAPTITH